MKSILMLLLLLFPSRQIEQINVSFTTPQNSIFTEFENENFVQRVKVSGSTVNISIENSNYLDIDLNYRLFVNLESFKSASKYIQDVFLTLFNENIKFRTYLVNISFYLRDNIKYWGDSPFKNPEDVVVYKKTNCIGYSAFVNKLLDLVKIKNRYVSGFYLKQSKHGSYEPVPHRWLEIFLPDGTSFFYDPQYQGFKANYIVVKNGNNFRTIRKFKINFLRSGKKLVN